MRKPRGDSPLEGLPDHLHAALVDKLCEGSTYSEARAWVAAEAGVTTSESALAAFYQRHCAPIFRERRRMMAAAAIARTRAAKTSPAEWRAAIADRVGELAFEAAMREQPDLDALDTLHSMLMAESANAAREKSAESNSRKIAILERKEAAAREAAAQVEKLRNLPQGTPAETRAKILEAVDAAMGVG